MFMLPLKDHLYLLTRTRFLAVGLVLVCAASIAFTYILLTREEDTESVDSRIVISLIILILCLVLAIAGLVARRGVKLWAALQAGSVGSRLRTRIVAMFTVVTIVPTIIVSVFSALFFNFGIQSWFDDRVSTALEESVRVAQAYRNEHKEVIRSDIIAMATDIERELEAGLVSTPRLNTIVDGQAALRSLTEAVVIERGRIIAQSQFAFSLAFERLPAGMFEQANHNNAPVLIEDPDQDKVRAIVKLKNLPETYLVVGRFIDSKVLAHTDMANGSVQQYLRLKKNISAIQIQFSIVFVLFALLLLFAAIWYGLYFAAQLVMPISELVKAAERVRAGDYAVRVNERRKDDEIGTLGRAFNRMTDELEKQRRDLIEANRQLDMRRRFSEAVLSGVSAGVMALTREHAVTLANPVAGTLLLLPPDSALKDKTIGEIAPEALPLFEQADEKPGTLASADIVLTRGDRTHVLHMRVAAQRMLESIEGYIVTFDDITALQNAQRSAAWSDVARRVAHEIKNPLTPIQLAAERLRKKYLPYITQDSENYTRYIDTITRHASDIGKIVEEFVSFARMPAPVMKPEDMNAILQKAVFSEQTAHSDITYSLDLPSSPVLVECDERQISQLLLNVLKNAAEAFEGTDIAARKIYVQALQEQGTCRIRICDNGPGFPPDKIHRLTEPYLTTRTKGTGLGLAIVKKIIDDHKAQLHFENLTEGGAQVTLIFSIDSGKNVT